MCGSGNDNMGNMEKRLVTETSAVLPEHKLLEYRVDETGVGSRLDNFLSSSTCLSRSNIQKLIKEKRVQVNGKDIKANYLMRIKDLIAMVCPDPEAVDITPENIPLDIVYQDEYLAVINKPVGMVVHPAVGNYSGTLVNALLYHCKDLSGINGEIRPGIVHRLDKDTSGVMVVAKNDFAHLGLAKQIELKTAQRVYIALVFGNIKPDEGEIVANIGRDPKNRQRMAVVAQNSRHAHTSFKVLERFGEYTLIACKLHTGRTHQIRVHMTHIGYPLVGDEKYTSRGNKFGIKTQLLHSASLTFRHPASGECRQFVAVLPDYFRKVLKILRTKKHK